MREATTRWWEESSGESVYLAREIWFIFSNARFFFVLLFEIYTSFLVKGFYAINRCVAMEAFFLVMFSGFSFYISFVLLPCFGNEMLIELFEKFKDNLIMYASFVSAAFIYLLVLFCFLCEFYLESFREFLCVVFPVYYKLQNFYNITFDKQNFENIYSRN